MTEDDSLYDIVDQINELKEDNMLPKSLILKLDSIIAILEKEEHASIKIDKALNELDELTNDANLPSYTRTQLWNIVSLLESM